MDTITEKQEKYIKILSSYEYSKKEDKKAIENCLKKNGKKSISQLSKNEASELITILLQRPTEYTFTCGKKATLHKKEVNRYHVLGDIEGCMHACPDKAVNGDVNNCPFLKEHPNGIKDVRARARFRIRNYFSCAMNTRASIILVCLNKLYLCVSEHNWFFLEAFVQEFRHQ